MRRFSPGPIYPITTSNDFTGWTHLKWAKLFLDCGIRFFQVREKQLPASSLLAQLVDIQSMCVEKNAALIVNDRLDLALASGAAGVHLGQDDLPVRDARRIGGTDLIVGISTHSEGEFLLAQDLDVDYVAIGPAYESPTKPEARTPIGIDRIAALAARKRKPLVAIGGISPVRARELWDVGVDSVAVISDITESSDPAARIEEYLRVGTP
jgi:thiamine-phosphate pyrophosphorylase